MIVLHTDSVAFPVALDEKKNYVQVISGQPLFNALLQTIWTTRQSGYLNRF